MKRFAVVILVAATAALAAQTRQPASLIVVGRSVITQNAARQVISPGAVAIVGNAIVDVGSPEAISGRYRAAQTISAPDQLILPGLINTHTHAPMVMYRGLADDLALMDWLSKYIFPAEAKTVSPEFVRIGTRLAALEMIESGTTTFADMYYFEEEIARATQRGGPPRCAGPDRSSSFRSPTRKRPAEALTRAERFISVFKDDPLIVPAVAPHALYTNDKTTLQASAELARNTTCRSFIHLAETEDEVRIAREQYQLTPAGYLESIGFWGPRTLAAHGVWVTDDDIAILKRHDVGRVAQPRKQHEAGERHGAGHEVPRGRRGARPRHRRRREQQRSRHVRGDAPGVVPRQARHARPDRGAGAGGARHGDDRRRQRARHVDGSSDRSNRASAPISLPCRCRPPGRRRSTIRCRISSTSTRGDDVRTTIVNGNVLMNDRQVRTLDRDSVIADANRLAERFGTQSGHKAKCHVGFMATTAMCGRLRYCLGVVEPVADDEAVFDREADVFHLDVDLPPRRLAQEARGAQRPRVARAQNVLQVGERQAGVDDVFDDDHVAAVERRIEIFQQPDFARTRRALGVARHGHEVERDVAGDVADQIGQKDECALQHGDQMQVVGEVAADFAARAPRRVSESAPQRVGFQSASGRT